MRVHTKPDHEFTGFAASTDRTATGWLLRLVPIALLPACMSSGPDLGQTMAASTVNDFGSSSGCSTAVVIGLSAQIADQVACEHPGGMRQFDTSNMTISSSAVLAYLEPDAAADLEDEAVGHSITVNSAMRTLAQQYLLVRWFNDGRCGITAAAAVGHSNHESGRAVDLANWADRLQSMPARGWAHDVPGDPVHFDHTASADIRNRDVHAFQTLWNLNNAGDQIAVDGAYGPQTEARLKMSPATGFAIGPTCQQQNHAQAELVAVDGPDRVAPGTQAHYTIAIQNTSATDWPDSVQLQIDGASSQLYDPSWVSQTEITELGVPVLAGATGEISFDVTTPQVTAETAINQKLVLTDGTNSYGTVTVALTVVPPGMGGSNGDPSSQSSDGDDTHDPGELSGGCNAGGGSGLGALAIALGAMLRRRRK